MSYKKRVIIFLSVVGVTAITLLGLYALQVRSSVEKLQNAEIVPDELNKPFKDLEEQYNQAQDQGREENEQATTTEAESSTTTDDDSAATTTIENRTTTEENSTTTESSTTTGN